MARHWKVGPVCGGQNGETVQPPHFPIVRCAHEIHIVLHPAEMQDMPERDGGVG